MKSEYWKGTPFLNLQLFETQSKASQQEDRQFIIKIFFFSEAECLSQKLPHKHTHTKKYLKKGIMPTFSIRNHFNMFWSI